MKCTREWVNERVRYWWNKLQEAFNYDGQMYNETWIAYVPKVEFSNRMTSTAGLAYSSSNKVKFSLYFMNQVSREDYDSTIGHELAHIWADKMHGTRCKHDWRWKRVMCKIGLPPKRCHSYKTNSNRIRAACNCPNGTSLGPVQYKRYLKGVPYTCGRCCSKVKPIEKPKPKRKTSTVAMQNILNLLAEVDNT